MISHSSPYGQTLLFSPSLYLSLSDEKLAEIEQNCASIDRETITIGGSTFNEVIIIEEESEENR